jgi:type IV pilus assembly protein PilP
MIAPRRTLKRVALVAALSMLAACGANLGELQTWVAEKRKSIKPNVTPLSAPKQFDPQPYQVASLVSPFSTQKLVVAVRQDSKEPNPLLTTEINRRREPLEAYPLDSMAMVGSMNKQGRAFALMRVDNLLYQVKVGDYLGQNYGRVMRIAENEVALREVVQDAAGEWVERATALQLQDKAATR